MLRHPIGSVGTTALRDEIELLVRPGRQRLVPGPAEDQLCPEDGDGSGRIGKDRVTSPEQLRRTTRAASGASPLPLLLSVNQEGGRLNALDWEQVSQLPGALALGAAGEEEMSELAGKAIGAQLRAVGLTWNLAPVCDLADWPSVSAVGTRALGSDPEHVARLAAGFVRGLQSAGVAATAKHFPGLGGVAADPHHAVPIVDRLAPGALVPFQAAVDAGAASVMIGSHVVREIDDQPAVISPRAIGLLRDQLGFDGVVVSENLSITAVHEPLGGIARAAVAAVAAGVDVVMLDSEVSRGHQPQWARKAAVRHRAEVVQALVASVHSGLISRQRISRAAERVLRLHHRFGFCQGSDQPDWQQANALAGEAAGRIAEKSVTVLRGAHLLPLALPPSAPLGLLRVPDSGQRRADSARNGPDLVPSVLLERHSALLEMGVGCEIPPGARTVVVYSYDTRTEAGARSLAASEAARLAGRGLPVVQIALGDTDDLTGSPADVVIAAFSPHRASVSAVADILFGQGRAHGTLPVRGPSW
ncbi:glycoside hydrolase family 3 protein [Streptomyces sp. NPDC048604]|uniref:glycoside hydrolase family 3 protein n=1 Tax=Streptomyces sp. NPDC048604 TaxID=3365578 RepID=UPI00371587E5